MRALVAELGNEERPQDIAVLRLRIAGLLRVHADAVHVRFAVVHDRVALDPGAEEEGLERHVVFGLAGLDAAVAADALVDLDPHPVRVIVRIVPGGLGAPFGRLRGVRDLDQGLHQAGGGDEEDGALDGALEEITPIRHRRPSGWWG